MSVRKKAKQLLLLHYKDISDFSDEELKLIEENKKISKGAKRTYLKKLLSDIVPGGYNESKMRPERFIEFLETAIERAEKLDSNSEDYPVKLGSHIYKLVQRIIK